jgi:hypothetical protein
MTCVDDSLVMMILVMIVMILTLVINDGDLMKLLWRGECGRGNGKKAGKKNYI